MQMALEYCEDNMPDAAAQVLKVALREALNNTQAVNDKNNLQVVIEQPQGEPVAWAYFRDGKITAVETGKPADAYSLSDDKPTPLYTTPPVVPQVVTKGNASEVRSTDTGEPVFLSYDDPLISETIKNDPLYIRGYEAAIEATKEKAAKVCEERAKQRHGYDKYKDAAAIRSMK